MPHNAIEMPESIHARRLRLAWAVWGILVVVVGVRTVIWLRSNNCVQTYFEAGRNWYDGQELYQRLNDTCRYSPFVHAVLVPFRFISERLGSLVWRFLGAGVFLVGLAYWIRAVCPEKLTGTERAVLLLLALPLSVGSFNNGQSNIFMMGGIMLGTAAAAKNRWWLAGAGITLACLFKLYPLSLGLLMMIVLPIGFAVRFAVLLGLGMALPFILQDPSYVARQYPRWLFNLVHDDRSGWALESGFRDLWTLIRLAQLPIDRSAYMLLQLGFAALAALGCLWMRLRGIPRRELLNGTMALGCCWMALCGPATESCTYILLAPTMAWILLETRQRQVPRSIGGLYVVGCAFLLLGAFVVIFPFGSRVQGYGPQPMGALILFVGLFARAVTKRRSLEPTQASLPPSTVILPGKAA